MNDIINAIPFILYCIFINVNINRIGQNVNFIRYADDKINLPYKDRFIHDLYQCREKSIMPILNVDGFKYINDLHGHNIGDALLISIVNIEDVELSGPSFASTGRTTS